MIFSLRFPSRLPLPARAVLASAALIAAPASAQVLGATPYAPAPDPVIERLQSRVDTLENELRKTTGRNESLAHDLNQAKKTAESAQAENQALEQALAGMRARVEALEALARGEIKELPPAPDPAAMTGGGFAPSSFGPANTPAAPGPGPAPEGLASRVDISTLPTDEAGLLGEARSLLVSGDYPSAHAAAEHYLTTYPKGANADSAQYLLGESMLYQKNYAEAASAYGKLLNDYPKSKQGPEALVKLSRALRLMGKKQEACQALGLMGSQFPKASATAKTLAATEKAAAGC